MSAETVYQDYMALNAHFNSNYNYERYNGKMKTSTKSSSFVQHKLFFEKVGKHKDPHTFLLANILTKKKIFIRDIAYSKDAERIYTDYIAKMQALTYVFKQDLKKLIDDFDANLKVDGHPHIVVLYLGEHITLETLCIVCQLTGCLKHWKEKLSGDPVINEVLFKINKYTPFLQYDKTTFRRVIVDEFKNR